MNNTTPQPFKSDDIDQVLTSVSGGVASNVRKHIIDAVELGLRDYLAGVVNLNSLGDLGAPQVMIRVRTFQTILDEFRRLLDERYPRVLEHIGENIGFNFGISLISVLRHANWIPLDFEALLEFWGLFDSSAQMGQVGFNYEKVAPGQATIEVKIKQLFLTIGYGHDEPLRHCDFMVGYLQGASDSASLMWNRWIRKSIFARPENSWRTLKCASRGQERDDITSFSISLQEEKFSDVRDTLVLGIEACHTGKWVEAMIDARICLETALLKIAGEAPSTRISFGRLLEQLRNVRADIDYERWRVTYAGCSEFAHQVSAHNEIAVLGYLFNVWKCVREAEGVEIGADQAGLLRKSRDRYLVP